MNAKLLFIYILHSLTLLPDNVLATKDKHALNDRYASIGNTNIEDPRRINQKRSIKFEWESSPSKSDNVHSKRSVIRKAKKKHHKRKPKYAKTLLKKTIEAIGRRRTDILTPKFHVTITERFPARRKHDEKAYRRSEFVAANDRENELAEEPADTGSDEKDEKEEVSSKEIVENSDIVHRYEDLTKKFNKEILNSRKDILSQIDDPKEPILKSIVKKQKKKKKLTKLFVRFMADMTQKLKLDPLTVADMMVKGDEKRSKVKRRIH